MAIFSISLRLLIPLKGVLKRVPLGRISLAMLFFYNGLIPFRTGAIASPSVTHAHTHAAARSAAAGSA